MKIIIDDSKDFSIQRPSLYNTGYIAFSSRNCTHYLVISGVLENDWDIKSNGILDKICDSIDLSCYDKKEIEVNSFKVRFVDHGTYVSGSNKLQVDPRLTCHIVYGCKYSVSDETLKVHIPENTEDSIVEVPLKISYSVNKVMTEGKKGFLGIGKKTPEFTGIYKFSISEVQDYQDGWIYYRVGDFKYYITKEMLGRSIYIKANHNGQPPELCSDKKSIDIVKS